MCKCILGWVVNEGVNGTHSSQPVFMEDYVALLEVKLGERAADSLDPKTREKAEKYLAIRRGTRDSRS